ncbi:MAG: ImmA/IrrE family metallo-endopeptidase [Dictyoglomus sp.]
MYENLIRDILSFLYIKKPPIKPDIIAYGLGLELRLLNLSSQISGILYKRNNKHVIIINKNDAITRQRFTLAHEIGHFLLHTPKEAIYSDYPKFQNLQIEREANIFAASLLIPDFILEEYLNYSVEKISQIFFVSKKVAEIRLKNLNTF